jgi:ABC-type Mn2+/Zn2+ transport system permease subunit
VFGAAGAAAGLALSLAVDVPGGPAIVLVLSALSLGALAWTARGGGR